MASGLTEFSISIFYSMGALTTTPPSRPPADIYFSRVGDYFGCEEEKPRGKGTSRAVIRWNIRRSVKPTLLGNEQAY